MRPTSPQSESDTSVPALAQLATDPPQVVRWFRVYAGFNCFIGFGLVYMGIALLVNAATASDNVTPDLAWGIASAILIAGIAFTAVWLVALSNKREPWRWTYNLVLICLGLSGCLMPVLRAPSDCLVQGRNARVVREDLSSDEVIELLRSELGDAHRYVRVGGPILISAATA